jgi:hypothetical protein
MKTVLTALEANGLDDAILSLRAVQGHDREIRLYAIWCARQVQHLLTDPRSLNALDVAERFANGVATEAELQAAGAAAWEAVGTATIRASTWEAAEAAAHVDAPDAREAARAAAWAAANAATWAAEWTVARNASAQAAARDAAWEAAREAQAAELRRICAPDTGADAC